MDILRIAKILLLLIAIASPKVFAGVLAGEEDGTPAHTATSCWALLFANGNLTPNADGTCSVADQGGSGSGDNVTVNSSAIDTTANLSNTDEIKWTVSDGGAGGPDDVEASLANNTIGIERLQQADIVIESEGISSNDNDTTLPTSAAVKAYADSLDHTDHGDGANCSAGEYPLGVDADGAVQSCTDATTEIDSAISTHAAVSSSVHGVSGAVVGTTDTQTLTNKTLESSLANVTFNPVASDGASLGNTTFEWADLFLADGGVINFGDDQDVTLTHNADAGLTLNLKFTAGDIDLADGGAIFLDDEPASDHEYSGITSTHGLDVTCALGDVVSLAADGDYDFGDADAAATSSGLKMCAESITAGNDGLLIDVGYVRDDTWDWTVGGEIYLSVTATTGNTLTQTAPSATGDQVVVVGVATHADRMYFNPSSVLVEVP